MKKYFTTHEINWLKENYPEYGAKYCADYLNRSSQYISKKASLLGLKINKKSLSDRKSKKFNKIEDLTIFSKLPNELVYLLGFIWADGYLNIKDKTLTIDISYQDGLDLQELFCQYIKFNIYSYNEKMIFKLRTIKLFDFLFQNDFHLKNKTQPSKIISLLSEKQIAYFVKGVFDGDGSIYLNKNNMLSFSGPRELEWDWLITIFEKIGCNPKVIKRKINSKGHSSSMLYLQRLSEIKTVYQWMPKIGLTRKNQIFTTSKKLSF